MPEFFETRIRGMTWKGLTVTSEEIRELVRKSYAAYDQGDIAFIFNLFDDDIDWKYFTSPEAVPFPNHVRGKQQVLAALTSIGALFETIGNTLELIVVEGDRAAVICDQKVRQRATGRTIRTKVAAFHRYRDGRLIEYTAFADSLDIMQQTLGRMIDLPEIYPPKVS
jgi:ketosteroid isomerase-like protein